LALGHTAIVVVNKVDRPDAQIDETVNKTFDLFVELNASSGQLDFPIVYTCATAGTASLDPARPGQDLVPLFETILQRVPPPTVSPEASLQLLVLALSYDDYKGRMGTGKIQAGTVAKGDPVAQIAVDGMVTQGKVTAILEYRGLERVEVERAEAGEIVSIAGLSEIAIGETIADAQRPVPLPPIAVDQPTLVAPYDSRARLPGDGWPHVTGRKEPALRQLPGPGRTRVRLPRQDLFQATRILGNRRVRV
jgi:GTP-binding protein